MDGSLLIFTAERLNRERAAALDREIRILRSIADRGVGLAPDRPTVHVIAGIGVWLRSRVPSPLRLRVS